MRNNDATYRRAITSRRWAALRRDKLTADPLCERCKANGTITAARVVHHIQPVESATNDADKLRLLFTFNNLMSLCIECHTAIHLELNKGTKEETQRRNKKQVEDAIGRYFGE